MKKTYIIKTPKLKIDTDLMEIEHVISSKNLDRYGTYIIPKGAKLENFLRNPKVLWYHNKDVAAKKIPIAKAVKLTINDGDVVATTRFNPNDPFSVKVFNAYKDGFLSAWSIGFMPKKYVMVTEKNREELNKKYGLEIGKKELAELYTQFVWGIYVIYEWELLEYSAVPVGANQDALVSTEEELEALVTRGLVNNKDDAKEFCDFVSCQKSIFTKEDLEECKSEGEKLMEKKMVKLSDKIVGKLCSLKETGMGYQIVNFILEDETKIERVLVLNADVAVVDESLDISKVTDVEEVKKVDETIEEAEERAKWTTKYKNSLPDSAFAVVEPAYTEGKTEDKNARHLPHHKGEGDLGKKASNTNLDLSHYKNARARANQIKPVTDSISVDELRKKAQAHLERHHKLLVKEGKVKKSIEELETEFNDRIVALETIISEVKKQNEKSISEEASAVVNISTEVGNLEKTNKELSEKIKSLEETNKELKEILEKVAKSFGVDTIEGLRELETNKNSGSFFDKLY